jgi:hypothetical protein
VNLNLSLTCPSIIKLPGFGLDGSDYSPCPLHHVQYCVHRILTHLLRVIEVLMSRTNQIIIILLFSNLI